MIRGDLGNKDLLVKKEKKGDEDIPVLNVKREGGPSGVKREGQPSIPDKKEAECPICKQVVQESRMNERLDLCLVSSYTPVTARKLTPKPLLAPTTTSRDTNQKSQSRKCARRYPSAVDLRHHHQYLLVLTSR